MYIAKIVTSILYSIECVLANHKAACKWLFHLFYKDLITIFYIHK